MHILRQSMTQYDDVLALSGVPLYFCLSSHKFAEIAFPLTALWKLCGHILKVTQFGTIAVAHF